MGKAKPEMAMKMMQFFAFLIFIFGFIIVCVVTILMPEDEERRNYYITACTILGGLAISAIVSLIASFIVYLRRKKAFAEEREKRLQRATERRLAVLLQETDELIDDSRRERLGTRKKSPSLRTKREYNITNYQGEVKNKKCSICKLELRKKQQIVQCNKCLNVFHKKHLEEWLEKSESCPVCGEYIVDIIAVV